MKRGRRLPCLSGQVACGVVGLLAAIVLTMPPASASVLGASLLGERQIRGLAAGGIRIAALSRALRSLARHAREVRAPRYLTLIDLAVHSSKRRMFVIDLKTGDYQALLVAHGAGSDPDHDGFADRFSNRVNSHMTSLGAYVTGGTYYGKHGLSLRLAGLDPSSDHAAERAIVIHGAKYVSPGRSKMGRSWGCPAIERKYVRKLLPKLAGGSFLYITN